MTTLGTIPPNIIKIMTSASETAGDCTGNVYTASTVGGIITTIIVGFYIIPNFGLRSTTYLIACVLVIPPFLFFLKSRILISVGIILVFALTIAFGIKPGKQRPNSHIRIVYKTDGLLGQMIVADDLNTEKRSLLVNNISQTFMHIPSRRSQWRYVHRMAMYASMMPQGSSVLLCGIGGGNLINELVGLGFKVDAVDLDARMAEVASKYFMMTNQVQVYEDDARHFIRTSNKAYDIVILDMSAGENQPSNVYTLECFKEIQNMLTDKGILFLHYQNVLEGENNIAIKSLGKTMEQGGLNPQLLNTDKVNSDGDKFKWDQIGELMLFGSKRPMVLNYEFDQRDRFADPFNFARGDNTVIKGYDFSEGMVLTDDLPIMDALHTTTLSTTRGASIKTLVPIFVKENIKIL
jgi:predicted membrane-bound spermidine synthase